MELPKGVNIAVPDLSTFRHALAPPKDPIAIRVQPGDRVMVLLPQRATAQEVHQVSEYLKLWAPQTEFLVLSGPESVTVIPAEQRPPRGYHPTDVLNQHGQWVCSTECPPAPGDPVVDKEPQGLNGKPSDCQCKGDYHYAGSDGLCHGE